MLMDPTHKPQLLQVQVQHQHKHHQLLQLHVIDYNVKMEELFHVA